MTTNVNPRTHLPDGKDIALLVKQDIEERAETYRAMAGRRNLTWDGRDSLKDAYQSTLDLAMFLRQIIVEASFYAEDDWK